MKKKSILWLILDLLLLAVVIAEIFVLAGKYSDKGKNTAGESEPAVEIMQEEDTETESTGQDAEEIPQESVQDENGEAFKGESKEADAGLTQEEFQQQAGQIMTSAGGVWEIYVADDNGNVLMQQGAGENIRAGKSEYYFLAQQTYYDIRQGTLDAESAQIADSLLRNQDAESYEQMMQLRYDMSLSWDEDEKSRLSISGEDYPYTFWQTEESEAEEKEVCYTSAQDGANLLFHVAEKAESGDDYAVNEKQILQGQPGQITDALKQVENQVLELTSEDAQGNSMEDYACVTRQDGSRYLLGFLVNGYEDGQTVKDGLSQITALTDQYYQSQGTEADQANAAADAQEQDTAAQTADKESTSAAAAANAQDSEGALTDLKAQLAGQTAAYQEAVSIYVKNLSTNESMKIVGAPDQKAASLIKLYVMATVYQCIEKGQLEETPAIDELLNQMITISDNESTNELVRRLSPDGTNWEEGSAVVNQYIKEYGFSDTSMGRDVQDVREVPAAGENYTSVSDCGKILEEIYRGTCVSQEASAKMLELLKNQERRWKIPAGVGEVLYTANKTGELSDTENDTAIIQMNENQAYILCVMTSGVTNSETAQADIVSISQTVYQYFSSGN